MSKPAADNALTEARAAYQQALENYASGRARATAYKARAGEVLGKVKGLRREHSAALQAAVSALDRYIGGEITEDEAADAEAAVEAAARRVADMEALAAKVADRPDIDLSRLIQARDDSRLWLSLACIEAAIGNPLEQFKAALPEAFHAWLIARPDAIQWKDSHSENERLWPFFITSIVPSCPDKPTLAAAKDALARRVPEVA